MASKVIRKIITTPKASLPVGHYSQAVVADKSVHVAGQLGLDPSSGKLVDGGFEAQLKQALTNLKHILDASGSGLDKVVKTTVLLNDIKDLAKVNAVYPEFFKSKLPCRTAYQVGALPLGALVEVEAFGIVGEVDDQ